jgi:3-isopropylmalate/(R)-2-methylmalate dehydratase small subunit
MQPFTKHTGLVVPLDSTKRRHGSNHSQQFLKRIERTGFGQFLFYDWRYLPDGTPNPEFIVNHPRYRNASILVTGKNFGCGSSREHAPWALAEYGIRAIIAPSFADIFANNCFKNGMLPIVLPESTVGEILQRTQENDGYKLLIDLQNQTVADEIGLSTRFQVSQFQRYCLLEGLDDIGLTLRHEDAIKAYEARRREI